MRLVKPNIGNIDHLSDDDLGRAAGKLRDDIYAVEAKIKGYEGLNLDQDVVPVSELVWNLTALMELRLLRIKLDTLNYLLALVKSTYQLRQTKETTNE